MMPTWCHHHLSHNGTSLGSSPPLIGILVEPSHYNGYAPNPALQSLEKVGLLAGSRVSLRRTDDDAFSKCIVLCASVKLLNMPLSLPVSFAWCEL